MSKWFVFRGAGILPVSEQSKRKEDHELCRALDVDNPSPHLAPATGRMPVPRQ
jgi:hypothetical protein